MANSLSYEEEDCLSIEWEIKNFQYCWKEIRSPKFFFKRCCQCCISLTPTKTDIVCTLLNYTYYDKHWQISMKTSNASQTEPKICNVKDELKIPKDLIYGKRQNGFLPEDTLIVQCRIPKFREGEKLLYRSQIEVKRRCILWNLQNFVESIRNICTASWGMYESVEKSARYGEIALSLKSVSETNTNEQYYNEISRTGGEKCYCVVIVSALDIHGKAQDYGREEYIFQQTGGTQTWAFPSIVKISKLRALKDLLLPNNTFSLKYDFTLSLGTLSEQDRVITVNKQVALPVKEFDNLTVTFKENSLSSTFMELQTDYKSILEDGAFYDARLQIDLEIIPVHKGILSGRSPIFKSIFEKEPFPKVVTISGLDVDTLRSLLLYIYTGVVRDYQWENISKLYVAGHKYQVLSLKLNCSSFLEAKLSLSNVCEILVLAEKCQDPVLKTAVLDFISKHNSDVFDTDAWKALEKNNSSVAFQVLREICSKK